MTDRYDRDGHELHGSYRETSPKQATPYPDDEYYDNDPASRVEHANGRARDDTYVDDGQESQWTFDEKRQVWVDRDGNPYVEAYAEGEEDRYAPYPDDEYLAPKADARLPQRPKARTGVLSLASLVLVASICGGFAYAWKKGAFVGSDLPGLGSAPPVIKASTDPVKIKPAETTAAVDPPMREIFDRTNRSTAPSNERLVSHEEQPIAVVPVRTDSSPAAPSNPAANTEGAAPTRVVATSNITLPPTSDTPSGDDTTPAGDGSNVSIGDPPQGLRRVKTIKILPDNSVITGDAQIVGSQPTTFGMRSLDTPAVSPTVPQTPAPAQTPVAAEPAQAPAALPSDAASTPDAAPAPGVAQVASVPATATPANDAASADDGGDADATTIVAPTQPAERSTPPVHTAVPPVRPRNIPAETAPRPTQLASAEPVSGGSYVVQVSSQKTPGDAQAAFQSLQRKYPSVVGGLKASIKKVELGERGTYYRVRVGSWASSTEAASFCSKLKAAGGDCVIARN